MRSKVIIVIVAVALGGVAAVLAAGYVQSARTDLAAQNKPVYVLVAQQNLPKGLTAEQLVEQGLVEVKKVPAQFVAGDAVSSERVIAQQVLATPVSEGEQLTRSRFAYPSEAGLSYSVPADLVAVSVAVDEVGGVAGLLKPGDNVAVFASYDPLGKQSAFTKVTIGKARVLAVGASTSAEAGAQDAEQGNGGVLARNREDEADSGEGKEYRTVTVAVPVAVAEQLAFANEFGTVQLALLPQNAAPAKTLAPVTFLDVAPKKLIKK